MLIRRDRIDLINEITKDIPQFNRDILAEYTKGVILNTYFTFAKDDIKQLRIRASKELIKKISDNKEYYRISKNFDRVIIQNVDVYDYVVKEDGNYIKMYANLTIFDDVDNNENNSEGNDKFWYDRWIVTFKPLSNTDNNCKNCGAEMEYDRESDSYICKYCRNVFYKDSKDWEVVDIEVEK